ncbi:MAG: T9SS type A sorting domain-containing protein [Chlorobi bacterium]|nr:T9SS type A sorting domain-containing protein [Chlorobiota bacterium]
MRGMGIALLLAWTTLNIQSQTVYFAETFTTVIPGTIPPGWQLRDGGIIDLQPPLQPDSTWTIITDFNGNNLGQGKFLFIQGNPTIGQKDTLETPSITILPGSLRGDLYLGILTFYNYNQDDTGYVQVWDANSSSWVTTRIYTGSSFGSWANPLWDTINITQYASTQLKVRFIWHEQGNLFWAIDSVIVFSVCAPVTTVYASWISVGDVVVSYSPSSYDSVKVEYGHSGFSLGTGTVVTFVPGISPDTITGLNPSNDYDFYVWGYCGSDASIDTAFTSLCALASLPYSETFNNATNFNRCWDVDGVAYIDNATATCGSVSGSFLTLWGDAQTYVESPSIDVGTTGGFVISYYYRGGNGSCGDRPEAGDKIAIQYWDGSTWQDIVVYDGADAPIQWARQELAVCLPAGVSITRIRIKVLSGGGPTLDSWHFDNLNLTPLPAQPEVNIIDIERIANTNCGVGTNDTIKVSIVNFSQEPVDTLVIGYRVGTTYYIDTISYVASGGFGACPNVSAVGVIDLPFSITGSGLYELRIFAHDLNNDLSPADTISFYVMVGERWLYADIHTGSYGSDVFWKLYYSPTNYLVASSSPGTYASNSTYTEAFCVIDGSYRFEAWDRTGDGWTNGGYDIYMLTVCGDTVLLADNGGQSPDNGSCCGEEIEVSETFTVFNPELNNPDIEAVALLSPDTFYLCGEALQDSIWLVIRNTTYLIIDTVYIGFNDGINSSSAIIDYGSVGGMQPCQTDTVYVGYTYVPNGTGTLQVWARAKNDASPTNDVIVKPYTISDRWVFVEINTGSYGNEVFWKVYHMPYNTLVASSSPGTYTDNSIYVDSFCVFDGDTYRFEAWDSYGDGWSGGTYSVYTVACVNDTLVFINNNGQSPDNGTCCGQEIEVSETFVINMSNVSFREFIEPNPYAANCVGKPVELSFILVNFTDAIQTADVNLLLRPISAPAPKDTTLLGLSLNVCHDTITINLHDVFNGTYEVVGTVSSSVDAYAYDNTKIADSIIVKDSVPDVDLPLFIDVCSKDLPVVLDVSLPPEFLPATYTWNTGDTTPIIVINSPSFVEVEIAYGNGCIIRESSYITVNPTPSVVINAPPVMVKDSIYEVSATASGGSHRSYQWFWQGQLIDTTPTIQIKPTQLGSDTLILIVANEFGCLDTTYHVLNIVLSTSTVQQLPIRIWQGGTNMLIIQTTKVIEKITVSDMRGKVLWKTYLSKTGTFSVDLPNLPNGVYLISLTTLNKNTITTKLAISSN